MVQFIMNAAYRDFKITQGLFLQKATHDFDYIMDLGRSPIVNTSANWLRGRVFGGKRSTGLHCAECPESGNVPRESGKPQAQHFRRRLAKITFASSARRAAMFPMALTKKHPIRSSNWKTAPIGAYAQLVFVRRQGMRGAIVSGTEGKLSFDWYTNELNYVEHHAPYESKISPASSRIISAAISNSPGIFST